MNNVVHFPPSETMTPEQTLATAAKIELTDVLILGYDSDDNFNILSSCMSRAESLFLVEASKEWIMARSR